MTFKHDDWLKSDRIYDIPLSGSKIGDYTIQVKTSDGNFSGTDDKISLNIFGAKGQSLSRVLDNKWSNDFETGKVDTFEWQLADLGTLTSVTLQSSGSESNKKDEWKCDWVKIIRGKTVSIFNFNGVAITKAGVSGKLARTTTMKEYKVVVKTTDKFRAGTDDDVKLNIIGSDGASGSMSLDNKMKNDFEQGNEDRFDLEMADLG